MGWTMLGFLSQVNKEHSHLGHRQIREGLGVHLWALLSFFLRLCLQPVVTFRLTPAMPPKCPAQRLAKKDEATDSGKSKLTQENTAKTSSEKRALEQKNKTKAKAEKAAAKRRKASANRRKQRAKVGESALDSEETLLTDSSDRSSSEAK
jgi:hypothetical protein